MTEQTPDTPTPVATLEEAQPEFRPKILGFLCNWCSYAGADLAGVSRLQMPPTLRVVRVLCSGSLDPEVVIAGLKTGSDGVIIMGCHPGDCHYLSGNYEALRKYKMMKKILEYTDFDAERLHLEWVSASEGIRFQEVITDFTKKITDLGPNPIRKKDENAQKLKNQLDAVIHATAQFRLRSIVGREKKITELGNAYGEMYPEEDLEKVKDEIFRDEYIRSNIILNVSDGPKTVEEMSEEIGLPSEVIFHHVARLWKKQVILPSGHRDVSPTYVLAGGE
jgi:coenzyme F420-reducing hydrogenase delta subunit